MTDHHRVLVLLRHAKSDYPAAVADHDRPLAPRGEREAGLAGDWLRSGAVYPPIDAVLCSTATRTRQTLARTGIDAPAQFLERIYGATPGAIIDEINRVDDAARSLLVIGHEPAMSQLALGLSGADSNQAAAERIMTKYPTSAMAVLRVRGSWNALELGGAALTTFYVPR
ncbi:MAG: histidine phosphatase family protein [Mycobacterium sp.]|nr:histidine phosphatase family protein [Mycobacterium sp.]